MFGKLCSIVALALTVTAVAQVRFPARVSTTSNVLSAADITYNGAIRMPAASVNTESSTGSMSGRQVGGDTHLFIWANSGGVDYPDIIELDVTGLTPNTDLSVAPRATLVTNWGDDYGTAGCRRSWEDDLDEQNLVGVGNAYNRGIHWRSTNSMLYIAWSINYTDIAKWSVAGITLDDDSPVTTTCYGPWRFSYEHATQGNEDGTRTHAFLEHPTTGKMYSTGGPKSNHNSIPWGPSLVGGNDWPTTATTGGIGMTPIEMPDTYVNYYPPITPAQASDTYSVVGAPLGTIKQFKFPSYLSYIIEIFTNQPLRVDPLQNGGIGTWSDENSGTGQPIWFNGTNKKGVIFPGVLQGSTGTQSTADCTNSTHLWYRNSANGYVKVTNVTGTISGGTMTGGTSGDIATLFAQNDGYLFFNDAEGDEFLVGETVSGTGWSAEVVEWDEFDTCNHGCVKADATGPVSTKDTSVMIIYDPAELERVKDGTIEDYEAVPDSVIDVRDTFSLITGTDNGKRNNFEGGYLNGTTLYMISHAADITDNPGNPNVMEMLIHVFTIDDSAPPAPVGYFPVLPFAAAAAVWMTGSLFSRRRPWGTV
jgi:hypothetical protein